MQILPLKHQENRRVDKCGSIEGKHHAPSHTRLGRRTDGPMHPHGTVRVRISRSTFEGSLRGSRGDEWEEEKKETSDPLATDVADHDHPAVSAAAGRHCWWGFLWVPRGSCTTVFVNSGVSDRFCGMALCVNSSGGKGTRNERNRG